MALSLTRNQAKRLLAHRARRLAAILRVPSDRDLVISFLFPPANETAGIVMAKRLREWSRDVDVIANEPPGKRKPDPGTLKVAGDRVRRVARVKGKKNALKDWSVVARFVSEGDTQIRRFERTRGPYRRVYSRSMMPASHFLAMQYKLRRPAARWTAEFSDPVRYSTLGELRTAPAHGDPLARAIAAKIAARGVRMTDPDDLFELVEYGAYVLADTLVFTNEAQRDLMLSKINDESLRAEALAKATVSPHPSPAPELYDAVPSPLACDPGRVEIAYFGAFYSQRGVGDLVAPLTALTGDERSAVRLRIFTDRPAVARAAADESGAAECIEIHDFLPFLEFLALAKQTDVLMLADARTAAAHAVNPYLPSKLSDYRGSGTTIWALVEPGSPLSAVSGIVKTPLDDRDAQTAYLRSLIAARRGHEALG